MTKRILFVGFQLLGLYLGAATRTSVATGSWGTNATWDCNCVPAGTDDIVIAANTTVTLDATRTANSLTVNASGIFTYSNGNKNLTVAANLTVNGSITGSNVNHIVYLTGNGTNIDGSGTISNKGGIEVNTGNKTILSTANLVIDAPLNINGAVTVTNNGIVTISGGNNITGSVVGSTWTNASNSTLSTDGVILTTGTFNASATGNTVKYYLAGAQNVAIPSSNNYYHLNIEGSGTKTLLGATNVLGTLTISSATLDVSASNFAMTFGGNFTNTGTFNERTGTVTFNGTSDQTITSTLGETFYNLTSNKSSGKIILASNVVVSNIFTMTAGNIDASTNNKKITLGTSTAVVGTLTYTAGSILGQFERWVAATATNIVFPVGTSTSTRSASVNFTNLTAGSLIVQFVASAPGSTGLPLTEAVTVYNTFSEGYWDLTAANSLASTNYALDLTGTGFTSFTITTNTRLIYRTGSSSSWSLNGTHAAATGSTAKRTTVSGLGQFAFGDDTNCTGPTTSSISGSTVVCKNQTGVAYSVTNTPGNTYTWTITGGTQASGTNTNSITVDWGATGMVGSISVVETNTCTTSPPVTLSVNVEPLPTSAITGLSAVPENTTGEPYSVTNTSGYSYAWTITGGTQASGGSTNSITVNWGAATSGTVSVVASNGCGSSTTVSLPVNVYVVINSAGTGNWTATTTWDCACVPLTTSSVRIKNTHTVSLTTGGAGTTALNLVIDAGGTLFDNAKKLTITGNVTNNGSYTGTSDLTLTGSGSTITGTGTFSNTGGIFLNSGSKTIASGASLSRSPGDITLGNGITVTNNGGITIAGAIVGGNAASTWINGSNSVLNIGGALLATGTLVATSTNNSVNYNGTAGQSIKSTDYYNVSASGTSTTTLTSNINVTGDVNVTGTLDAASFNINVSGNWSNAGTFTPGTGTVTFNGTTTQTITNTAPKTFNNLTLSGSGTKQLGSNILVNGALTISSSLDVTASNYQIELKGNFVNNGTFTARSGKVVFSGAVAQTISGSSITTFNDIDINTGASVSLSSAQKLDGTIALNGSGAFNTNNQFTLTSNSTKTGRIAALGTPANFSGNITMERFAPGSVSGSNYTGWALVGSAVAGRAISDWDDDIIISCSSCADGSANGFTSIYGYTESTLGTYDNGYVAISGTSDAITDGKGYWVYLGNSSTVAGDITMDVTGTPVKGNVTMPVTYTDDPAQPASEDGWNLISNPYPSPISWTSLKATASVPANIDDAVYVWNADLNSGTGGFAQYVGGVSTPASGSGGVADIIASSQAFYIHLTGATTLTANENIKSAGNPTFLKSSYKKDSPTHNILRLAVEAPNGNKDETVLRLHSDASEAFDKSLDAYKMFGDGSVPVPYIYTELNNNKYSINSISNTSHSITIPLRVTASVQGNYKISVNNINEFESGSCLILEDLTTGDKINLRELNNYSFALSAGETTNRFLIHVGEQIQKFAMSTLCKNENNGEAIVIAPGNGPWQYTWKDQDGTILKTVSKNINNDTLHHLAAGVYHIEIIGASSMCANIFDTIQIDEPETLNASASITPPTCMQENNGQIQLAVSGGTFPFSYSWSANGSTSQNISNISAGIYGVTITDDNGCSFSINNINVIDPPFLSASFTSTVDTLVISEGASIQFINTSAGAQNYEWNFGNGSTSTQTHPYHLYTENGDYEVVLTASYAQCRQQFSKIIIVRDEPTQIQQLPSEPTAKNDILISVSQGKIKIENTKNQSGNTHLMLYNSIGQLLLQVSTITNSPINYIDLPADLQNGIYIIDVIISDEARKTQKLFIQQLQ